MRENKASVTHPVLAAVATSLSLLVFSCSGGEVRTASEKNVDTAQYKNFRWLSQEDAKTLNLSDPNTDQPVQNWVDIRQKPDTEQKVKSVIVPELERQGYVQQSEGQPDFFVTFYSPTVDQAWLSSWSGSTLSFQGAPLVIFPNFDMQKAKQFRPGMAYVVMYDAKTKRPAWTGTIVDAISPAGKVDAPAVTAKVDELIARFKAEV